MNKVRDGRRRAVLRRPVGWMLSALIVLGCAAAPVQGPPPTDSSSGGPAAAPALRAAIRTWLGTPHRLGGMSRGGIDCSGLVVTVYDDLYGMRLPRTTRGLLQSGRRVGRDALAGGDLVFFQPDGKFNHVGIYLGRGEFAHASSSRGVIISRMDDPFWHGCYLTGRRLR